MKCAFICVKKMIIIIIWAWDVESVIEKGRTRTEQVVVMRQSENCDIARGWHGSRDGAGIAC